MRFATPYVIASGIALCILIVSIIGFAARRRRPKLERMEFGEVDEACAASVAEG